MRLDKWIVKYIGRAAVSAALLTSLTAPLALAHGGHDLRLKVSVSISELRVETSVPSELFLQFDRDGDGALSLAEAQAQRADINLWLDSKVVLKGDDNVVFKAYFSDAPIVNELELNAGDPVDFFKILRRYKLGDAPKGVILDMQVYDHDPIVLFSRAGVMGKLFPIEICASRPSIQKADKSDHGHAAEYEHDKNHTHSHEVVETHTKTHNSQHDDIHHEDHAPLCYRG